MSGKKSYEEPERNRGNRESPGRSGERSSPEDKHDRDFGGEPRREDPMKNPGERSPREPRI